MNVIHKVTIVSDGMVVEFDDTTICYFAAETLYTHRAELNGQLLLDHDPGLDEIAGANARKTTGAVEDRVAHCRQIYLVGEQSADERGRHLRN